MTLTIQHNSGNIQAYWARGLTYAEAYKYDEAIQDFEYILSEKCQTQIDRESVKKKVADVYINRGYLSHDTDMTQSLFDYSRAIELNSEASNAYVNRGSIYIVQGNQHEAISDLTKAIKLNSELPEAFLNLGSAFAQLGNFDKAKENYESCIAISKDLSLIKLAETLLKQLDIVSDSS